MRILMCLIPVVGTVAFAQGPAYTGSAACGACHKDIYARWSKTRMANVVRDPKVHPDAIIPDLSKADPLVTFKKDDIAFVYGSKWKQRYFTKRDDEYYPFPAQWDIKNKVWRAYAVRDGTDWWTQYYPGDNFKRPTGPLCDGCHSVNYDIKTRAVTEWNVGCEKCHGPGAVHAAQPTRANIVNPARIESSASVDICVQCHSQGQPLANPIEGRYYDWAVGFRPGLNLWDFWKLEEHKKGETTFTHFPDGTAHKNRMQGNDFVTSAMYYQGVTCSNCHDVHGTANNADLRKAGNDLCMTCHAPRSARGPREATIEQHTHHRAGSTGNECIACHMPSIEQTIADVNVRSHTFRVPNPAESDATKMPNPCTSCHTDKSNAWAADLKKSFWK